MLRDSMDARQEPLLFRGEPAELGSYSSQPLTQDTREDLVDSWEQGDWTEVRVVASIPFFMTGDSSRRPPTIRDSKSPHCSIDLFEQESLRIEFPEVSILEPILTWCGVDGTAQSVGNFYPSWRVVQEAELVIAGWRPVTIVVQLPGFS